MVQMSIRLPARSNRGPRPGLSGPARVDRRTKDLTKRLRPGDIAVIDHEDLDRVSAEALVACKPAAVVNASSSISGRYPNLGPEILVAAGIPLLDRAGPDVMAIKDGTELTLDGGAVRTAESTVATATVLDNDAVQEAMTLARAGLSDQLEAFAQNTMDYLRKERELLFDGVGVPDIRTDLDGRHALIVVRGYHYKDDLQTLRHYIREYKPILIGVDGGADALIEARHQPDLIVGDMDSVSDDALRCGAEIVVHAYRDGRAPGLERVRALGVEPVVFPATGTSEDVAMLLADDKGASLIVAVGTHVDAGRVPRQGPLRHGQHLPHPAAGRRQARRRQGGQPALPGPHLQPQPGAHAHRGAARPRAALWSTDGGRALLQVLGARIDDLWSSIQGVFG